MNTKAIKSQAKQVGLVTAGFMGANAITKVAPIQNDKIKAVLPLALGIGTALASKNANLKVVGAGVASYGLLKTVRTLLMGSDPMGTNGIQGITDNPAVKKMLDMLIPNLGNADFDGYHQGSHFEPAIIDVPFEEVNGVGMLEEGSLLGSIEEEHLLGFKQDYQNEMYL